MFKLSHRRSHCLSSLSLSSRRCQVHLLTITWRREAKEGKPWRVICSKSNDVLRLPRDEFISRPRLRHITGSPRLVREAFCQECQERRFKGQETRYREPLRFLLKTFFPSRDPPTKLKVPSTHRRLCLHHRTKCIFSLHTHQGNTGGRRRCRVCGRHRRNHRIPRELYLRLPQVALHGTNAEKSVHILYSRKRPDFNFLVRP